MDAPPPHEDVRPFVDIAARIKAAGLHAPEVLAVDEAQGFLLLSDLGGRLYLQALTDAEPAEADRLMRAAIGALVQWQTRVDASGLPPYDDALLRRELQLFPDWCVQREFGVTWTDEQRATWQHLCDLLVQSALAQPRVAVHRDWMPRNLMIAEPNPASWKSRMPCTDQSPTTWPRCCATPSSRGTKSARSTGRCAGGSRRVPRRRWPGTPSPTTLANVGVRSNGWACSAT
ncbi:MAG TPA: phosphotransferase [Acidobacteriota bacterium]|nr:phosphotransferase [Acidobacteriota bacterium]